MPLGTPGSVRPRVIPVDDCYGPTTVLRNRGTGDRVVYGHLRRSQDGDVPQDPMGGDTRKREPGQGLKKPENDFRHVTSIRSYIP